MPTAEELIEKIRAQGGRVYRMQQERVFCLTSSPELAEWLTSMGAKPFLPPNHNPSPDMPLGSYERSPGGLREWDLHLTSIPLAGSQTLWEALG